MGEVRRVVVATREDGQVGAVIDGAAPARMELPAVPGTVLTDLWRSDELPTPLPTEQDPTEGAFELMPAGSLFRVIDLAPTGDTPPMWHRTASVDFVYVASGRPRLLFREGSVELGPGDSVVVGAVEHAWVNGGDHVARLVDVSMACREQTASE